jgi:hypothetical protein
MRSNQVFARMNPEAAEGFLETLIETDPATATLVLNAVSGAFKLRPKFLRNQPRAKQAEWMRKVLGRTASAALAEEILASYFLSDQHIDLLTELLDALGIGHEDGQLVDEKPTCPPQETLEKAATEFLKGESSQPRQLLLEAFAAQSAIDWPALEALIL